MAGKRIRGLAETTTMANTDYVILDNSVLSESKKISKANLLKEIQAEVDEKQDALGYTAENIVNKSTDVATDGISDTKYPSVKATKDYADTKLPLAGGQLSGIVKDASFIEFPNDNSGLFSHAPTVAHTISHIWSSGKVHGFELTDNGNGTVSLADGDVFLRNLSTSDPLGDLVEYHVSATPNISLVDNSVNYICIEYNSGVPQVCTETDITQINARDMVAIYIITRVGTTLYYYDIGNYSSDFNAKYAKKIVSQKGFEYGGNGAIISKVGILELNVTESAFYYINERIETPSFDTFSGSDTFTYVYRAVSGFTRVTGRTSIDITKYDNGTGTLATLNNNKYATHFVYLVLDTPTKLYVVYGRNEYNSQAEAEVEPVPSTLPPELQAYSTGVIIGKIIVKQGVSDFINILSPFLVQFNTSTATTHNNLAGLNVGDYQHLSSAEKTDLTDGSQTLLHKHRALDVDYTNSGFNSTNVDGALSEIATRGTDVKDPTGWINNDDLDVSYNPTTRQITLSRPSLINGIFYYFNGKKTQLSAGNSYTFTAAHPNDTTTKYYLYSTDGVNFTWSATVWRFSDIQVAMVPMHRLFALKETHGANMTYTNHESDHLNIGTYRLSGGDLTGVTLGSTTAIERRPNISMATIKDEDLPAILGSQSSNYCYAYLSGATGTWNYTVDSADILRLSTNQPYYNLFTGGVWTQALMGNNTYTAFWLIAIPTSIETQGQKYRYVWLQGQANGTLAQQQARTSLDLNLGEVANESAEYVFLAKAIVQYNAGNWNIAQIDRLSGTRFSQTGSPNGNYLSSVSVDGTTITGNGTVGSPLVATGVTVADDNYYQNLQDNIDLGNLSDVIRQSSMVSVTGTGVKNGVTLSNPISFKDAGCRVEVLGQTLVGLGTNMDFSNGTTGWNLNGGVTATTSSNEAEFTVNTINSGNGLFRGLTTTTGNKIYVSAEINPKYATGFRIGYDDASTTFNNLTPNVWNKRSTVVTKATSNALVFYHDVTSNYIIGDKFKYRRMLVIDLTAHYGTGNEPTAAQMDLIAPSWFNGTVNVVNPLVKTLGKNVFNNFSTPTVTSSNTVMPTTNSLRVLATASGSFVQAIWDIKLIPNTVYFIKSDWVAAVGQGRILITDSTGITAKLTLNSSGVGGSFTSDSDGRNKLVLACTLGTAAVGDVTYTNLMLELGTVATTYEAFKSNSLSYNGTLRSVTDSVAVANETVYTASTWAEWTNKVLVTTSDATGLEVTGDGVASPGLELVTTLKPNTKYVLIINILSNTSAGNMAMSNILTGSFLVIATAGVTGIKKYTFTTQATIAINKFILGFGTMGVGLKTKFKDVRIIELPSGSQLEADATNLTADQLASNIPYFQSTGTATLSTVLRDRLYNALGLWKVDRYIASGTGLKQTMATESATVTGTPYVYRDGTTSIETAVIAPITDWKIPYADVNNTYTPTLTWTTATPTITSSSFKYALKEGRCILKGQCVMSNGGGATNLTITLPVPVKVGSGQSVVCFQLKINATWTAPIVQIIESTNLVTFKSAFSLTNGQAAEFEFYAEYEVA